MTNMQHYMEDIQDVLEGLEEEMEKRTRKMIKWEGQIVELAEESKVLQEIVFDESVAIVKREKKAMELAEIRNRMRHYAEKKAILAERNTKAMTSIVKRIKELAFNCKMEIEVDNPGAAQAREDAFDQIYVNNQAEAQQSRDTLIIGNLASNGPPSGRRTREMSLMTDDDVQSIRSETPAPKEKKRGVGRPRTVNKDSKSSTYSSARSSMEREFVGGYIGGGIGRKDGKLSNYMRKKQERMREEQRIEEEMRKRRIMERVRSEANRKDVSVMDSRLDSFGTMDEPDADEQELLDLLPSIGLPSPPRDIMETLDVSDAGMFAMSMYDGNSDEIGGGSYQNEMRPPYAPVQVHGQKRVTTNNSLNEAVAEKRRRNNMLFGSIADTSFSGRPRKLTDRVTEMMVSNREREERRRSRKEDDIWCICDGNVNSEMMVECENGNCKIEWFHFECVGLTESPNDEWYCSECRRLPSHMLTVRRKDE